MPGDQVTELVDDDLVLMHLRRVRLVEEVVRVLRRQPHPVGHGRGQRIRDQLDIAASALAVTLAQLRRVEGQVEIQPPQRLPAQCAQCTLATPALAPWFTSKTHDLNLRRGRNRL